MSEPETVGHKYTCGRCDTLVPHFQRVCPTCFPDQALTRPGTLTPEAIARVCYEANRGYCRGLGDFTRVSWGALSEGERRARTTAVIWRIENLEATPSEIHDAWMRELKREGWILGDRYSERHRTHPNLRPWDELPAADQRKDILFASVIDALTGPLP